VWLSYSSEATGRFVGAWRCSAQTTLINFGAPWPCNPNTIVSVHGPGRGQGAGCACRRPLARRSATGHTTAMSDELPLIRTLEEALDIVRVL
ncbi:MAG: hypothetical protein M3380_16520, partial [Chloroflexota bacterium]|nr:hypothetical protein [Chloroflexota bacterium]